MSRTAEVGDGSGTNLARLATEGSIPVTRSARRRFGQSFVHCQEPLPRDLGAGGRVLSTLVMASASPLSIRSGQSPVPRGQRPQMRKQ